MWGEGREGCCFSGSDHNTGCRRSGSGCSEKRQSHRGRAKQLGQSLQMTWDPTNSAPGGDIEGQPGLCRPVSPPSPPPGTLSQLSSPR